MGLISLKRYQCWISQKVLASKGISIGMLDINSVIQSCIDSTIDKSFFEEIIVTCYVKDKGMIKGNDETFMKDVIRNNRFDELPKNIPPIKISISYDSV